MVKRIVVIGALCALSGCENFPALEALACLNSGFCDAGFAMDGSVDGGHIGSMNDAGVADGGTSSDAGTSDAGPSDAGASDDGGVVESDDGGSSDAGQTPSDGGGPSDAGRAIPDAGPGFDAGVPDSGVASGTDAGTPDAGAADAGVTDAGVVYDVPFFALENANLWGNQPRPYDDPTGVLLRGMYLDQSNNPVVYGSVLGIALGEWNSLSWGAFAYSLNAHLHDSILGVGTVSGKTIWLYRYAVMLASGEPIGSPSYQLFEPGGSHFFSQSTAGTFARPTLLNTATFTTTTTGGEFFGVGWTGTQPNLQNQIVDAPRTVGLVSLFSPNGSPPPLQHWRVFACNDGLRDVFLVTARAEGTHEYLLLQTNCPQLALPVFTGSTLYNGEDGGLNGPFVDTGVTSEELLLLQVDVHDIGAGAAFVARLGPAANYTGAIAIDEVRKQAWVAAAGGDAGARVQRVNLLDGGVFAPSVEWPAGQGDEFSDVVLDTNGKAYVVGTVTQSFSLGASTYSVAGASDGVVLRLNAAGALERAMLVGGSGADRMKFGAIAVGSSTRVYVVGITDNGFSVLGSSVASPAAAGVGNVTDAVLLKFVPKP